MRARLAEADEAGEEKWYKGQTVNRPKVTLRQVSTTVRAWKAQDGERQIAATVGMD